MKRGLFVVAVLAATLITTGHAAAEDGEDDEGLLVSDRPYICDESRAGYWETFIHEGYVLRGQHCGSMGTILRKLDGNYVGADEPAPGVVGDLNRGQYVAVYENDRVPTPYCVTASGGPTDKGCPDATHGTQIRTELRTVGNAPRGPFAGQPVNEVVYTAAVGHRAVRGTDGECYREFVSGAEWRRSGAYGTTEEACRRAAWNAYDRSRNAPMRLITETPPDGDPPAPDSQVREGD
ncbi:MAG: hypothetical protein OXI39_06750 [Gemmatimonadota bacterium]|uniref:hypothetical protein n=1 Tax=Candidatus Palauibacter scopulicola TaxID=3056741 RepID=UPI0023A4DF5B|nr:hypothetical protein [Candidatus Palauibacter scopulicola]MDE2662683.1 hypothetical protein [Candidatus Palauibacter scopulicola]